ncbi:hypothetical protein GCM10007916_07600 [Psychromonas marina]|uniref:Uncharacterized protein n=1 Tax=Psychromonas marina TaxID=88364 RepID=A0ABQ6DXH5_9GAMM|nr:hypothetical protein [Psychromonas marina]GLS89693.1 hypothetical protein GCM10007916_07600 [Psychromonas marina]
MKLLADKNGEQFLNIIEEEGDSVVVQFISNQGELKGKPFRDSLSDLMVVGWTHRGTSTAIGLNSFKDGGLEDARVSFALHQLYPMGRKVRLPSGEVVLTASYANTHADGYYMYIRRANTDQLSRMKITPDWVLLPSDKLLALPYYPKPRTQQELDVIDEFERWSGGF